METLEITPIDAFELAEKRFEKDLVSCTQKELIKFLIMKAYKHDIDGNKLLSPSVFIDECWHYLILNTKLYKEVCEYITGLFGTEQFIHHDTKNSNDENRRMRYQFTLTLYEQLFNEKPPCHWNEYEKPNVDGTTQIFIKQFSGQLTVFKIDHTKCTMFDLKVLLFLQTKIPPWEMRLIYCGKQLWDDDKLCDKISNDKLMNCPQFDMVLRLRGC